MTWVVVGLGNPGEEFEQTRHNAGRMALFYYAKQASSPDWKEDKKSVSYTTSAHVGKNLMALVLPNTFMNKSGNTVAKFVKSMKAAERLIVVYDDLDLPLGKIKVSFNRGSGGHKGIESIARMVKTKKFTRIRVGIAQILGGETVKPKGEKDVEKFILGRFKPTELDELKKVFKKTSQAIDAIVTDGPMIAMNHFN